jgi:hypothetical protein
VPIEWSSLVKGAERVVDARLEHAGFERRRRGEYVCEIGSDEGILGWLGISPLVRSERRLVEAMPYVGVYDPEVEQLVARLRGKRRRFSGRTVGVPLGEVSNGRAREPYVIAHHEQVDEEAIDRMLADVDRYGRPFMTANGDREELRRTIEKQGEQHDVMFRLPVVLVLLQERKAAKHAVARAKREFRAVTKAARAYAKPEFDYDDFAERFETYLENKETARKR